jgi:hypothetical protein
MGQNPVYSAYSRTARLRGVVQMDGPGGPIGMHTNDGRPIRSAGGARR